jgi:DNA mismatch repair ATPase MutS
VLSRYASMISAVEKFQIAAPMLVELKSRLVDTRAGAPAASEQIKSLHSLVNLLDARLNVFFALSFGPLLMWDLNLVLRAERFRTETGPKLRGWLEALAELEALASFAALGYERRDYTMPELVDGPPSFRAQAIAHPLIDRTAVVANDLDLGGPGSVLLLSGSNMSGKSTLLRAVGINTVLARAGCSVAASSLSTSSMDLATSVRIVDSLASGTSHFYAELKRIKVIVDEAKTKKTEPVLYLLDEMLHGTNSRERFIGAVSVIKFLSLAGAMGIVTTHDLSLARIEQEIAAGLARNMHFGDEVKGGEISFDYRLKPGPVSSTNALRLMRAIGIDVELIEAS